MLDLTKQRKYYELVWFDGTKLSFPLPTQELVMKVMKMEDLEIEEQFIELDNLVKYILSTNLENREFTEEDYKQLDLSTISMILEDYMNSVNDLLME